MATLLDSLDEIRARALESSYAAAVGELKNLVEAAPLSRVFKVSAGCTSPELTHEITRRFNAGGVKAEAFIDAQCFIMAEPRLPPVPETTNVQPPKLSTLLSRYGCMAADDSCFQACRKNALLFPRLLRYLGMGHYEIVADCALDINKFFIFQVGGSSGQDVEYNQKLIESIDMKDAITFGEVIKHLRNNEWTEIVDVKELSGASIETTLTHTI